LPLFQSMSNQSTTEVTGEGEASREYAGSGEKWASEIWKAYNKGCDHRAYKFAGEHIGGKTYQWEQWSEDERIAYLRGYNGQFINSERQKAA
jgi:hypothetical protein